MKFKMWKLGSEIQISGVICHNPNERIKSNVDLSVLPIQVSELI